MTDAPTRHAPALDLYAIEANALPLRPARPNRDWMDGFTDRQPYRCLPLTMANSTGWELCCPFPLDIHWNGGPAAEDIRITSPEPGAHVPGLAVSHFREGIVTFHTGYIFRTPPGWGVWASGPPNWPKDGIGALEGLIETDWLPFPFTMNWQLTRKGHVRFEKDEPFCFLTLTEHHHLETVQPIVRRLDADRDLARDYHDWQFARDDFIKRLNLRDPDAVEQGWQRDYMRGHGPSGQSRKTGDGGEADHATKRRMQRPRDLRGGAVLMGGPGR